jgi:hypothetical protein
MTFLLYYYHALNLKIIYFYIQDPAAADPDMRANPFLDLELCETSGGGRMEECHLCVD